MCLGPKWNCVDVVVRVKMPIREVPLMAGWKREFFYPLLLSRLRVNNESNNYLPKLPNPDIDTFSKLQAQGFMAPRDPVARSLPVPVLKSNIDNRKGCWWWHLMEHIHNNLMKLGGSLGNISPKFKKLVIKTRYIFRTVSPFSF
jgi:hypothetical protein